MTHARRPARVIKAAPAPVGTGAGREGRWPRTGRRPALTGRGTRPAEGKAEAVIQALRSAVANLAAHVEEVDRLNVFPVPDGDTGSNMLATARAALAEAESIAGPDRSMQRVAAAISLGALMGARGNSGLILSQILRGMAEVASKCPAPDGGDLARALQRGSESAYAAIARPVEGTMLTVSRECAAAASQAAGQDTNLGSVLATAIQGARDSVARTPRILPALREAGVVDAGGEGLFLLLEGMLGPTDAADSVQSQSTSPRHPSALSLAEAHAFGYETVFVVTSPGATLDPTSMRDHLEQIAGSVVVAGDGRTVKVHAHNERPDEVIAYGLSLGTLTRIAVENLDQQVAGEVVHAAPHPQGQVGLPTTRPLAVVSMATGDGLARTMTDAGAAAVVTIRDARPPRVDRLVELLSATRADAVILLVTDAAAVGAAQQAARVLEAGKVSVLRMRSPAQGIAALLAFDERRSTEQNTTAMTRAAGGVRTLTLIESSDGVTARDEEGQLMATGRDVGRAAVAGLAALPDLPTELELLTVHYGEGVEPRAADRLAAVLSAAHAGTEVAVLPGGQRESYLVAAE